MFSSEKVKTKKKKQMTKEEEQRFYDKLKRSIVTKSVVADDHLPSTVDKLAEQLEEFHAAIQSNKRNGTYMKCLMGRNLVKIQTETGYKGADLITSYKSI